MRKGKNGFRPTRHYYYWLQEGICSYCRQKVDHADFTVEHIVPVSKGGPKWDARNCTGTCIPCNAAKADSWPTPDLWQRMMIRNGWSPRELETFGYSGNLPFAMPTFAPPSATQS